MPSALNPAPTLADIQQQQQQQQAAGRQRSSSSASHDSHDSHSSGSSHSSHSSYAERHPDRVPPKPISPSTPFVSVLLVLGLILFYNVAGLWLFVKGFLLTRVELEGINQCVKPPIAAWAPPRPPAGLEKQQLLEWSRSLDPQEGSGECTLPATHSRAVLIIIDALRYDFIAPIPAVSSRVEEGWKPNPYYHGKITVPSELDAMSSPSSSRPGSSFLAHFAADAPTTTLQRLKGLTTGTLPTFIEAGANFGGMGKVNEDNWLAQFRAKILRDELHRDRDNAGMVFAGDDTWATVFPHAFDSDKVWSYDSFNVEDLDTVDAGVESKLLPFLQPNHPDRTPHIHGRNDWRLLVGHTLGVDHVGHRFGASHPNMEIKMMEMQRFLLNVTQAVDDDTLVILMGDHGMDERGDHGGDGELEIGAGLWIWSRSGFGSVDASSSRRKSVVAAESLADYISTSQTEHLLPSYTPFSPLPSPPFGPRGHRSVPQIDIVPTLSILLGIPVPFNSLGSVIPELFPSTDRLLRALRITAFQIKTYLDRYTSESSDLASFTSELDSLWLSAIEADARFAAAFHAKSSSSEKLMAEAQQHAAKAYALFNRASLIRARSVWAQFEMVRIWLGLVVLTLGLASSWILWSGSRNGLKGKFASERRSSSNMEELGAEIYQATVKPAVLGGGVGLAAAVISRLMPAGLRLPLTILDLVLLGSALASQIGLVVPHFRSAVSKIGFESDTPNTRRALQVLGFGVMVLHAALFASNSFTVWEDRVLLALLGLLLLARCVMGLGAPTQRMQVRMPVVALLALVLVRLASIPRVCREEQAPTAGTASALNSPYVIAASYVIAYLLPWLLSRALDSSKSFVGIAPVVFNWILRPTLLIGSAYWAVDFALPLEAVAASSWRSTLENLKNLTAKLDLAFLLVAGIVFWVFAPLCLELRQETISDDRADSPHPNSNQGKAEDGKPKQRVSILGYANSLGSSYLLLLGVVLSTLWIVTQPAGQLALAAAFLVGVLNAELGDSERDVLILYQQQTDTQTQPSVPKRVFVSTAEMASIVLLGHIAFFGTGHQATLASIQWRVAFVGFSTVTYPWSPILVVLNSFGHLAILPAMLVPLSVMWNYAPRPRSTASPDSPERKAARMHLPSQLLAALLLYLIYQQVLLLSVSSLSALAFRRHLMLFKIWVPRFMLATVSTLLSTITAVLATLASWQTANKVNRIFGTEFQ
ncbi:hypothetical protein BCV70DRAFT_165017 [Testicularia cyperi]|uniref:Uncharacterized protein n=1 Tax=Testicularia cyperi TaxID=1882483 RepID=A0A317XLM1_9BASI|nr:hypothetical protein BCV70DRAFT_165017 [Testicularia cyperi]